MKIDKEKLLEIIKGSTILGTGGGGRYDSALSVLENLAMAEMITFDELGDEDIVITAYGAGGLTKEKNSEKVILEGIALLQKQLSKKIAAVVPVEIGPYAIAQAFEMAEILGVPVVDGDLVGCRSVPEIFIELVTLADLKRTPLVLGNNEGDLLLLDREADAVSLERIVRSFADISTSNSYVLGYPYDKAQLETCIANGSVSYCLDVASDLTSAFQFVGKGKIISDSKSESGGFTKGTLEIQGENNIYKVEYKNEFLILFKDDELVVTCPDFICIVDSETMLGINNGDDNRGKQVDIYIKPAISQWLTPEGIELFSPRNLGYDCDQKLVAT